LSGDLATSLTINDNHTGTAVSAITSLTDTNLSSLTLSGSGANMPAIGTLTLNSGSSFSPSLTITNNNTNTTATATTVTVSTIADTNLSSLTFAGTRNVNISTISTSNSGTSLSITNNSTSTSPSIITTYANTALTTLTLGGTSPITITNFTPSTTAFTLINTDSGAVSIPTLTPGAITSQTIMNNGTGSLTIGATNNVANSLATLTLINNVAYNMGNISITTNAAAALSATSLAIAPTTATLTPILLNSGIYNATGQLLGTVGTAPTGLYSSFVTTALTYPVASGTALTIAAADTALTTVNAASDSSPVNLFLGADNNAVTINLGNGANRIVDCGTGNMSVTLGTGANTVTLSTGTNTITFAAHTATDTLNLVNLPSSASTSPNLTTVNGFVLGSDKVNLSIQAFNAAQGGTAGGTGGAMQLVYGFSTGTGILATDSSNSANLISNTPQIVNFPTVAGQITNGGSIYSFGTTVYTVSSLASFLNSTNFTYSSNTVTSGTIGIAALVTFGDGVHLEVIRLPANASSTLNNVQASGISDMIDFVGTSMGTLTNMSNSFSFVL